MHSEHGVKDADIFESLDLHLLRGIAKTLGFYGCRISMQVQRRAGFDEVIRVCQLRCFERPRREIYLGLDIDKGVYEIYDSNPPGTHITAMRTSHHVLVREPIGRPGSLTRAALRERVRYAGRCRQPEDVIEVVPINRWEVMPPRFR